MLQNAFKLERKKQESRSSDGGDASLSGVYRVPVYRGRFCCYLTCGVDFAVTLRMRWYVR